MGRWSYRILAFKELKVTFALAYRVCIQVKGFDRNTVSMQQWRALMEKYRNLPEPRKQTTIDVKKFLKVEQEKGREVVLMIDANEDPENRTDERTVMINKCKLIDMHAKSNPLNEVETYIRGKQRIDYMLATERNVECVNIQTYRHITKTSCQTI